MPCNQFGEQEPGTAKEIAEFCEKNYGVKFDMLAKVDVNGDKAAPLYKYLTSKETDPEVRRQDHLELREVSLQSRRQGRRPLQVEGRAGFAGSRCGDREGTGEQEVTGLRQLR